MGGEKFPLLRSILPTGQACDERLHELLRLEHHPPVWPPEAGHARPGDGHAARLPLERKCTPTDALSRFRDGGRMVHGHRRRRPASVVRGKPTGWKTAGRTVRGLRVFRRWGGRRGGQPTTAPAWTASRRTGHTIVQREWMPRLIRMWVASRAMSMRLTGWILAAMPIVNGLPGPRGRVEGAKRFRSTPVGTSLMGQPAAIGSALQDPLTPP